VTDRRQDAFERIRSTARVFRKIVCVMPAYNAETTLEATVADIPPGVIDEIILVDDCSKDRTVEIARRLGLTVIQHECNQGYGANQKTCYREALARGADVVIMVHPDYQYDPRLIPCFIGFLQTGVCDVLLGSRIRTRRETLESGMPIYKYLANRVLTMFENVMLGQNLGDFHTGFRAYTAEVLRTVPWERNSDDFVFDTQFLVQAVYFGFRIGDVPVPVRYFDEASSINFARSLKYGLQTVGQVLKFVLQRMKLGRFGMFERSGSQESGVGSQENGNVTGRAS
jgi:glycosyltransferase involved in cell wall biosynthesis